MLVTFQTRGYSDITMFGDVAKKLLHMMGHSGTVPSAIRAADVPDSLNKLKEALNRVEAESGEPEETEDGQPHIGLGKRAWPLVELLEAAVAGENDVMWR